MPVQASRPSLQRMLSQTAWLARAARVRGARRGRALSRWAAVAAASLFRGQSIEARLARAEALSGGRLAVAALDCATGDHVGHRARERLPMASIVKVAVAIEVLARVDAGRLALTQAVPVAMQGDAPGQGPLDLASSPAAGGRRYPLLALLELMLIDSDNTACDALLAALGGPRTVAARLAGLGAGDIHVQRTMHQLITDLRGVTAGILHDPRDTATPLALARLMARVVRGEVLAARTTDLLLGLMRRSTSGADRIVARLPPGARPLHKSGTLICHRDEGPLRPLLLGDLAVMALPDARGTLVVVFLLAESDLPERGQAAIAAAVGRMLYKHFAGRAGE